MSRTEAKRRYITTLIDTMHKYASPSPDSRELVAELEFVWDQVKSNVPSSSSSSPLQTLGSMGLHMPPSYPKLSRPRSGTGEDVRDEDAALQVRSPMSQSEEDELEDEQKEEFVDAPDSQYNPDTEPADVGVQADLQPSSSYPSAVAKPSPAQLPQDAPEDPKWRKRIEASLIKMTAEVAALREQLEARRLFSYSKSYTFFRWIIRFIWSFLKHVAIDIVILGLILLWMRRKKDRRLEGAVRVLLGDAVAQVQKVGGIQMQKVGLGGKKGGKL
jgi:hypothetical protein